MDILEEAANVASEAESIHTAQASAFQVRQIIDMMAESTDYSFVFLIAQPSDNGGTMVRQLANIGAPEVFWMLNIAAKALMSGGQWHGNEAS
jgi:hypothetical protein